MRVEGRTFKMEAETEKRSDVIPVCGHKKGRVGDPPYARKRLPRLGREALDEIHEGLNFGGGLDPVAVEKFGQGVAGVVENGVIVVVAGDIAGFDSGAGEDGCWLRRPWDR